MKKKGVGYGTLMTFVIGVIVIIFLSKFMIDYIKKPADKNTGFLAKMAEQIFDENSNKVLVCDPDKAVNVVVTEPDVDNKNDIYMDIEQWKVGDVKIKNKISFEFSEKINIPLMGLFSGVMTRDAWTNGDKESDYTKAGYFRDVFNCQASPDVDRGYTKVTCNLYGEHLNNDDYIIIFFPDTKVTGTKRICKSQQKIGFKVE